MLLHHWVCTLHHQQGESWCLQWFLNHNPITKPFFLILRKRKSFKVLVRNVYKYFYLYLKKYQFDSIMSTVWKKWHNFTFLDKAAAFFSILLKYFAFILDCAVSRVFNTWLLTTELHRLSINKAFKGDKLEKRAA